MGSPGHHRYPRPIAALDHLEKRGASFITELDRIARDCEPGSRSDDVERALWDLVWAGQVTNDTFFPLLHLGQGRRGESGSGYLARSCGLRDP